MAKLGTSFAHRRPAASVSTVVNDDVLTFLRRAERYSLGSVARADVERGFREPIVAAGRLVGDAALQIMVDGAAGYPFLLQLIGAQTWWLHPNDDEITEADAAESVTRARRRLGSLIHEPALSAASDIDKSFLLAMAHDNGPSKMADIQRRLDVDVNHASQYRLRLIAAELIHPTPRLRRLRTSVPAQVPARPRRRGRLKSTRCNSCQPAPSDTGSDPVS